MQISAKDVLGAVVFLIIIAILLNLVLVAYNMGDESMKPELRIGDQLLINKMAYNFGSPGVGDIVLFNSPEGNTDQIKRVIGLPGDVIEVKNNLVYVNDVPLNEPYVRNAGSYSLDAFPVPPSTCFVLEDNRDTRIKSSPGTLIPLKNVVGKVWMTAWPPDRWGSVASFTQASQIVSDSAH
jgi:signal peptidase I